MNKKLGIGIASLALALTLSACGNNNENESTQNELDQNTHMDSASQENMDKNHSEMDHSAMEHSSSGEIPEGLKEATNPTYKVGDKAILKTDHMAGMEGAEATIVGAFDTIAYVVSYTPTTGGAKVEDHKWVVQEEIKDAGDKILERGTEVTLEADHMKGMEGATATIDSAEATTVYMVDYTSTTDGEKVKNHKWVTESELSSK